jgi:6,7-dimethyl-8-ribityllumazine synthase
VRLDGDAALALEIHGIEHLLHHLPLGKGAGGLQKTVRQRALAVVNMRNDREIPDEFGDHAVRWGLKKSIIPYGSGDTGQIPMSDRDYNSFEGELKADGLRFAIVVSRFNAFITDRLLAGALDAIERTGGAAARIDIVRIPGAWEFPITVRALAARRNGEGGQYDAILCLGAVIRGQTPHFDYVAGEAARGIAASAADTGIPIAFGVLTTNTVEQAIDRAGAKGGNKGFDAAMTAIEMANLLRALRAKS